MTGNPKDERNEAVSKAMYEPPTIRVLLGAEELKISSEL